MSVLKVFLIMGVVVTAMAAVVIAGTLRWSVATQQLRARIENARHQPLPNRIVDFREIEKLPLPVKRYFRAVLKEGRPMVAGVSIRHQGTFNLGETTDRWRPFVSEQRVIIRRPGFVWNARVNLMPGLNVFVHDAYVAGEGILHAALCGLVPLVNLHGTGDLAEGELMRFLAEAPWYPTALLPRQGIQWEALDDRSARATLEDGSNVVTMIFEFTEAGTIQTVTAEARGRIVGKRVIPTPWQGRFWDYQERDGMQVPLEGEVGWVLPGGIKPYWRGRITAVEYEFVE